MSDQFVSTADFQKVWEVGGTQNKKMTELDWFILPPLKHSLGTLTSDACL